MAIHSSTAEQRGARSGAWHPQRFPKGKRTVKAARFPAARYASGGASATTVGAHASTVTTEATAGSWFEELFLPIAQVATGIMVGASTVVAYTLAPRLALLPALVGIGLIATGIKSIWRAYETFGRR